MKKNTIGILFLAGLILISCGGKTENQAVVTAEIETTKETAEQTKEKKTKEKETKEAVEPSVSEGTQIQADMGDYYANELVAFTIDPEWMPIEGYEGMFATADQKAVYGINGSSMLGLLTPKEFYLELKNIYGLNASIEQESDELTEWESSDGVIRQTAAMLVKTGERSFSQMEVVIAPDKNLVVTLMGQYGDADREAEVKEQIAIIRESLLFRTGDQDFISSNTFLLDGSSQLCLKDDKSFYFYQSETNHSQNYYVGTYDVYYGQEAFDFLDQKKDYAGTKENLEKILLKDMGGYTLKTNSLLDIAAALYPDLQNEEDTGYRVCRDTFYVVVLHNDHVVLTNGETKDGGYDTTYVGYYIPELNMVDMANPATGGYFNWIWQEKTVEMDVEPHV